MTNASGQLVRPAKNDGFSHCGFGLLESKQRIRISYEDSICRGNCRTSPGFCYLGSMISDDAIFVFIFTLNSRNNSQAGEAGQQFPMILT